MTVERLIMENTFTDWTAERGYTTRDGDRVALMERGENGPRAVLWSYDSGSPQFVEYADRSEALAAFMRSYDRSVPNVVHRWASGW